MVDEVDRQIELLPNPSDHLLSSSIYGAHPQKLLTSFRFVLLVDAHSVDPEVAIPFDARMVKGAFEVRSNLDKYTIDFDMFRDRRISPAVGLNHVLGRVDQRDIL